MPPLPGVILKPADRPFRIFIVVFCIVLAGGLVLRQGFYGPPVITLINESGVEIQDMNLAVGSWRESVGKLPAGSMVTYAASSRGESAIYLSFKANGKEVTHPHFGYVEGTGGYIVEIRIDSELELHLHGSILKFHGARLKPWNP